MSLFRNESGWVFLVTNGFYSAMREHLSPYDSIDFEDAYAAWDGL